MDLGFSRLLTPSHAFSRLLTPSHAFARLRAPSRAFSRLLLPPPQVDLGFESKRGFEATVDLILHAHRERARMPQPSLPQASLPASLPQVDPAGASRAQG